jgi:hypothetical protein
VVLPPVEQGQELADQAEATLGTDAERASVEALDAHFQSYATERELHKQVLPRLSDELIQAWISHNLDGLRHSLNSYDEMLEESNLQFGYCDVVARFYRSVFRSTEDIGLKRLAMSRLVVMGHQYNRFFVHDVVVELLPKLDDPCDIEIAEEVIQEHAEAASWYAASALKTSLPAQIATALRAVRPDL